MWSWVLFDCCGVRGVWWTPGGGDMSEWMLVCQWWAPNWRGEEVVCAVLGCWVYRSVVPSYGGAGWTL
eukprot:2195080-Amphidinium_carterae.1